MTTTQTESKTAGQVAYEEDLRQETCYQDGGLRPQWKDLHWAAQAWWDKTYEYR